ncbi:MAG: indole-3-glycerol phosphate synthase TrpC [Phycisphaerae bacterium]
MAANILHRILETKRKEVRDLYDDPGIETLKARAAQAPAARNFYQAMTRKPVRALNLIAEVKKASPSAGVIREDFDPVAIARMYQQAGADAISVLTDEPYFQGSLEYLSQIRQAVDLPLLRKDFIIDPIQIYQARAAGADAILLIAAALESGDLMDLMILSTELRMTVLIEVHDADELLRVRSMVGFPLRKYGLLGINNRDLTTFTVDLGTTIRLAELADEGTPIISESGIKTADDVARLKRCGVKGLLVGETLMRSGDPAAEVEALLGPAR